MSAKSLSTVSSDGQLYHLKPSPESLVNLLSREDSISLEGGGFYSKYEPQEVLGR